MNESDILPEFREMFRTMEASKKRKALRSQLESVVAQSAASAGISRETVKAAMPEPVSTIPNPLKELFERYHSGISDSSNSDGDILK